MAIIVWRSDFSVGVEKIDDQHKTLINLVNDLHNAMSQGVGKEMIGTTLNKLIQYTETHFSMEEKMMKEAGYPDFPQHKKEHEKFVKEVLAFQSQFKDGKIGLSITVMNFLRDWLTNHILGVDKKYSAHFASKGIK